MLRLEGGSSKPNGQPLNPLLTLLTGVFMFTCFYMCFAHSSVFDLHVPEDVGSTWGSLYPLGQLLEHLQWLTD